jgi:hypothetical protein
MTANALAYYGVYIMEGFVAEASKDEKKSLIEDDAKGERVSDINK